MKTVRIKIEIERFPEGDSSDVFCEYISGDRRRKNEFRIWCSVRDSVSPSYFFRGRKIPTLEECEKMCPKIFLIFSTDKLLRGDGRLMSGRDLLIERWWKISEEYKKRW